MDKRLILIFAFLLVFSGGIWLGFYIHSQTINPQATVPNIFERIDDLLYHDTGLADFIVNGSAKTKVAVEGIVDKVAHQPDGDYHVVIRPSYVPAGLFLVTEFIPEIKDLPLPKEGDYIKIWGITRFDEPHNWWELHPVIGWEKIVK